MNTKIIFLSLIIVFLGSGFLFGQKNYRTLVYEGNEKFNGKDYDGASVKYLEAIRKNSQDFTGHYNLGNALYKSKKYEEAKAEFDTAQKLARTLPDKAAALHNLGNAYMQMKKPEKAAEVYRQSLKQNPYSEATRKNYEIAKLKEKENQQKQQQKNNSGKGGGGGKDQQQNDDQKGGPKDQKQDQGQGQQNQGKGQGNDPNKNQNNEGKIPKGLENQILNKVSDKEKETAKRILNKNSYSMPESNEKDW